LELLNLDLECHFNGCTGTLQPKVVNYLHTSPNILRATSSGDVQTVSSPSRDECSAFGPSASNDTFDVGFSVSHQRTLVSQHEGTRATRLHLARRSVTWTNTAVRRGSNLYIFHLHLLSLEWQASDVIAMCGRVHSPTNDSVNHPWLNLGECIRRCVEVAWGMRMNWGIDDE
jgi:hypothetical protein